MEWPKLKPELHIMRVLKYGNKIHILVNVIFGHWVVFCMKWLHSDHHSMQLIWKVLRKPSSKEISNLFQVVTQKSLMILFHYVLRSTLKQDLQQKSFLILQSWNKSHFGNFKKVLKIKKIKVKKMMWKLLLKLRLQKREISILSEINFQEVNLTLKMQRIERNLVRNKMILQIQTYFQAR